MVKVIGHRDVVRRRIVAGDMFISLKLTKEAMQASIGYQQYSLG